MHPEPKGLGMLTSMLGPLGHTIVEATTGRKALRLLSPDVGVALLAIDPEDPEALELISYIRRKYPDLPVLVFLTTPHPERGVQALRLGACEVLRFPIPARDLRDAVAEALGSAAAVPVTEKGFNAEDDDGEVFARAVGARASEEREEYGARHSPSYRFPAFSAPAGHPDGTANSGSISARLMPLKKALEEPERQIIVHALEAFGWNRQEAAKALDINRTTLYKKMKKYGLLLD